MDNKFDEIRKGLSEGKKPTDLIKAGYAKSSVYAVAKTMRDEQLPGASSPGAEAPVLDDDDELAALRRRKEIVKLEKEIADIESGKGTPWLKRLEALELEVNSPEGVPSLREEIECLRQLVRNSVDTALSQCVEWVQRLALYQQYPIAKDWCDGWVEREIEPKIEDGT